MFRKVLKTSAGVLGVAGVGGAILTSQDEGTRRSVDFWVHAFPVFLHYKMYQVAHRQLKLIDDETVEKAYESLHDMYSPLVRDLAYDLRGFYLKQAQLLSTQDDIFPPQYLSWMKDTQDKVPSEFELTGPRSARAYCAKLLKEEQGRDFDDVFSEWIDVPLGVASIGQVHKARLKDSNQWVAVKLLVPGIEDKFRADCKCIRQFCELAMPQHASVFGEMERGFQSEFDYREEAANLRRVRFEILPKWGRFVEIPRPLEDLSSRHMLTMDFLEGEPLIDGIRREFTDVARLSGKTLKELEEERTEAMRNGTFKFLTVKESHDQAVHIERMLWWNDFMNPKNWKSAMYNYTAGWFVTPDNLMTYERTRAPLDLGHLLQLLCDVHASEVFEHGFFNGDPHPGNVLLLKDGRLGLIDYGQVKELSMDHRLKYALMLLAHRRNDREEVVRLHFSEGGTVTRYRRTDIGYLMNSLYVDRDTDDVTNGLSMPEFLEWMESEDPMVQQPEDYIILGRVNLMLRGMGKAFGLKLRMSEMWGDAAQRLLEEQGVSIPTTHDTPVPKK